jgi:hypothetical protein
VANLSPGVAARDSLCVSGVVAILFLVNNNFFKKNPELVARDNVFTN